MAQRRVRRTRRVHGSHRSASSSSSADTVGGRVVGEPHDRHAAHERVEQTEHVGDPLVVGHDGVLHEFGERSGLADLGDRHLAVVAVHQRDAEQCPVVTRAVGGTGHG